MKIMHCSDVHLGRRPVGTTTGEFSRKRYDDYFAVFEQSIEQALQHHVRVMILSGDLFDRKELVPEVLERTERQLTRLNENDIRILLIEGNHDNITVGKESESWLIYLENKGYIRRPFYTVDQDGYHFNPITIEGIAFYGLGFPGSMVNETLKALADHLDNTGNANNIVIVHTAIGSPGFVHGTVEQEVIDLFKGKVLYIAGGHYHSFQTYPQDEPYFFVPGSPEYWDLNEPAGRKGCIVFDTGTGAHSFIKSVPRTKIELTIMAESTDMQSFKDEFKRHVESIELKAGEDIVIVTIHLMTSFYVDRLWCENLLMEKGALRAQVKFVYPGQEKQFQVLDIAAGVEEVEKEIIKTWALFSGKADEVHQALSHMKSFQKENNRDQFLECLDNLLELFVKEPDTADENK